MFSNSISPRGPRLALAAAALALLAACAAPAPTTAPAAASPVATAPDAASAPVIEVPPSSIGTWIDLGAHLAPWLAGEGTPPASGASVPTRVAGLQRADGRWLALVVVQRVPGAGSACPPMGRHSVAGADGCLRMRRDADFDRWLQQQNPVLQRWVEQHDWSSRPRTWISDRASGSADALEAVALVEPALLEPTTRNNNDFLTAGQNGLRWARQFASATQATAGGQPLRVPPFPYSAPLAAPPAAAPTTIPTGVVTAPPAATAEQVMPARPAPRVPRADRQ